MGRRTGRPRTAILGYLTDDAGGEDVCVLAMNGWGEGDPAWWLNLQDTPEATMHLPGRTPRPVRAHAADGDERERLWAGWRTAEPALDDYAAARSTPTTVVVLTPVAD